jgi:hypothetical protein
MHHKSRGNANWYSNTNSKTTNIHRSIKRQVTSDDATRAWNFSVAIYYKAEGYPWKLTQMSPGTCYAGITFYKDLSDPQGNIKTSMAQVFTHTEKDLCSEEEEQ